MSEPVGVNFKSRISTLSDDATIVEALRVYHYGVDNYSTQEIPDDSIEGNFRTLTNSILNLGTTYVQKISLSASPNIMTGQSTTTIPLTIRAIGSQTSPLQQWQDSTPANVGSVSTGGFLNIKGYLTVGTTTQAATTGVNVEILDASHKGITVKSKVSQTANLQEWQNSSSSAIAWVDKDGKVFSQSAQVLTTASTIPQSSVTSLVSDLAAKFPLNVSTNDETASYTLALTDAQKIVEMNYTAVPVAVAVVAINTTTSVVTVTTSTNHGLVAGERAFISNLTNSNSMYNGSWAVTGAPTLTTFTFTHTTPTLANRTVTNVALTTNVATLTTSAAHGFAIGNTVIVSGITNNSGIFNGTYTVTGTPTTTSFTYAKTNTNIGSAAATGTPLAYASSAAATGTSPNVYEENVLTIPLNSVVAFPIGTSIFVVQTGPSQTTIAGAAGVTINSFLGLKIIGRWAGATLIKRAENTWVAVGGLVA